MLREVSSPEMLVVFLRQRTHRGLFSVGRIVGVPDSCHHRIKPFVFVTGVKYNLSVGVGGDEFSGEDGCWEVRDALTMLILESEEY